MRKTVIILSIFMFIASSCGQTTKKQEKVVNDEIDNKQSISENDEIFKKRTSEEVATIIELVKNGDKKGISKIVSYPLDRIYPIPPVRNEKEFIERFDEIFDSKLIEKISNANSEKCWGSFGWRGLYMIEDLGYSHLYLGFGDDFIYSIEYSDKEKIKSDKLIEAERKDLHESLKTFLYPVILMESPTHLIRIDCIQDDANNKVYRYASWKKGSSISDKPDLVLTNGVGKVEGSGCYGSYTFINGNFGYICGVGMWGNPQYIDDFYVYKNIKIDEDGWIGGDIILEQKGEEIKVIYWSEECKLRKTKE